MIAAVRRSPKKRWSAVAVAWAVAAIGLVACHGHDEDPPDPTVEDVVFVAPATDEALLRLLDLTVKDVAAQKLVIAAPSADAVLSKDTPAAIEFHQAATARSSPARPRLPAVQPQGARLAWVDELLQLVGPIRSAHAHGEPFNGDGYFLVVSDATGAPKLRVFTGQTAYTPAAADWSALAGAQQPLALSITWATFEQNEVTADGGPFVGGSVSFQIR